MGSEILSKEFLHRKRREFRDLWHEKTKTQLPDTQLNILLFSRNGKGRLSLNRLGGYMEISYPVGSRIKKPFGYVYWRIWLCPTPLFLMTVREEETREEQKRYRTNWRSASQKGMVKIGEMELIKKFMAIQPTKRMRR